MTDPQLDRLDAATEAVDKALTGVHPSRMDSTLWEWAAEPNRTLLEMLTALGRSISTFSLVDKALLVALIDMAQGDPEPGTPEALKARLTQAAASQSAALLELDKRFGHVAVGGLMFGPMNAVLWGELHSVWTRSEQEALKEALIAGMAEHVVEALMEATRAENP